MNKQLRSFFGGSLAKLILLASSLVCLFPGGHFSARAAQTSAPVPGIISDVTIAPILNWTKENGVKTAYAAFLH